jgi:hypothetical protein
MRDIDMFLNGAIWVNVKGESQREPWVVGGSK